ncbi:DUF3014 domain-containing protein [Corallococcus caeni]|uniref:Uncharacterized protein n=1 Tax=Corallococcus caeni TaxID=3082388 RepID=A0ABQ6QRB1_9BACT|nr:hypothetical protein ASNO1_24640 [Corallococcus sp. NO1]
MQISGTGPSARDLLKGLSSDADLARWLPKAPVELTPKGALYVYADPSLEALGAAEKHLLRMGPENMRKLQAKLTELAAALGLPSAEQARQP